MNDSQFSSALRKMPTRQLRELIEILELERELLGDNPRMEELMHASRRVRDNPKQVLEWVLSFCTRDLDQLSAGDWENMIYEVVWFSVFGPFLSGPVPGGTDLQNSILDLSRPLPSKKTIREIQGWAKTHLEEFIAKGVIAIPLQSKSIIMVKRDRKAARAEMMLKTDDLHQSFTFSFAQTLREAGASLNQCPECQKYYPARSNQTYCSPRCQNRVSLKAFRDKAKTASSSSKKTAPRKKKSNR